MGERIVRALVLWMSLLGSAHARNDEAEARKHAKKATALYEAGQYDAAIAEYQEAYKIIPLPDFKFDCGQAARLKGDREQALRFYQGYLSEAPNGRAAEEARSYVMQFNQEVNAEKARREAELAAERAQKEAEQRRLAEEHQRAVEAEAARARSEKARRERILGVAGAGLGVLGIVAGGVLSAEAKTANDQFLHPANGMFSQSAYDHRAAYQNGEIASFVLGGAFIAAGVALYVVGWHTDHRLSLRAAR